MSVSCPLKRSGLGAPFRCTGVQLGAVGCSEVQCAPFPPSPVSAMPANKRVYQTFSHDLIEATALLRTQFGYRSDSELFRSLILYEIEHPRPDDHRAGRYWSNQTPVEREKLDRQLLEKVKTRPRANTEKIRILSAAAMKIETRRLERFLNKLSTQPGTK